MNLAGAKASWRIVLQHYIMNSNELHYLCDNYNHAQLPPSLILATLLLSTSDFWKLSTSPSSTAGLGSLSVLWSAKQPETLKSTPLLEASSQSPFWPLLKFTGSHYSVFPSCNFRYSAAFSASFKNHNILRPFDPPPSLSNKMLPCFSKSQTHHAWVQLVCEAVWQTYLLNLSLWVSRWKEKQTQYDFNMSSCCRISVGSDPFRILFCIESRVRSCKNNQLDP